MTTPVFTSSAGRMQFVVGKADKVGLLRVRKWLHLAFRTAQQSPTESPAAPAPHAVRRRQGRQGGSQNKGCFAESQAGWLPGVTHDSMTCVLLDGSVQQARAPPHRRCPSFNAPSSLAAGQRVGPINICRISPSLLPQDVGDLPSPTEGSVELRRQPGGHFAAVSFSGRAEEEQARRPNHLLLSCLDLHSAIKSCICHPGSLRLLQNSLATASLVHAQLETLVEWPTKSLMSVRRCSRSCGSCGRQSRRTA